MARFISTDVELVGSLPTAFWLHKEQFGEDPVKLGDLIDCVNAMWSPTLGDESVIGWVTVLAYLVATALAFLVSKRRTNRQRIFWFALSVFCLALAINKQLDLQSAFTVTGRCIAQAQGWYHERRFVQLIFILVVLGLSCLAATSLVWLLRRHLAEIWLAVVGVTFLLMFIAVRAADFHHFDQFIKFELGRLRVNWILEISGILAVATNSLYLILWGRRASK